MNLMLCSGSALINGVAYHGTNITIDGDTVTVDGVKHDRCLQFGPITVTVTGDVDSIQTSSGDVHVTGGAGSIKTVSGDVSCCDVAGSISSVSGDVSCRDVAGSISSVSGDVIQS